ncbi:ubiquitin carboxyl-terminal hydrolase family protein [Striga asiatica]|uniref:Ubiquitin carboxyl-terminal hydrolase family protein n=1 Tax=Striga asiatica TaxID=4170 RepID=A0A5A7P8Y8_STRAF|nr:ubiquitin carboxyl-terminal hydrolase family protein [Striga asiatica]
MALLPFSPLIPTPRHTHKPSLQSQFLQTPPKPIIRTTPHPKLKIPPPFLITCSSSSPHKPVRDPKLDRHIVKQNKIRFVQKLKTLLLSKPKHFIPVQILYKCRSFLSIPKPRSLLSMIRRYPTIFELFSIPTPPFPLNASGPLSQLCVRLTPQAAVLAKRETDFKKRISDSLASKLQKLLMLASPHHRLLLSKLVHLGPDLGFPANFRSRLCNDYPDRFKTVETSYGRALELVSWDQSLAEVLPRDEDGSARGLIVDRPLKFKHVKLRKGLNVKKRHREFLLRFGEIPSVCPYGISAVDLRKESLEAEKRACAVVREVLGMTVEKRSLVDHLTHFRKEFGLPNRLRGMLVRHPEMFYVSLKGQRDSVFLVEGYSEKGVLLVKDEMLEIRDEMMRLVREGKRMRRERRREYMYGGVVDARNLGGDEDFDEFEEDDDDGLDDLFAIEEEEEEEEYYGSEYERNELMVYAENADFWTAEETAKKPW